jgi:hypothetical protein
LRTAYETSERRACCIIGCERASVRYRAKRPDDASLRERLRALAHERRFGYRRLHVLLRREGYGVNRKCIYRLYREERLMVRKRSGRKRALGTPAPMVLPMAADMRWSLDFISDQVTGRPAFSYPVRRRRLHPRMPGAHRRYIIVGRGRACASPASWTPSWPGAESPPPSLTTMEQS